MTPPCPHCGSSRVAPIFYGMPVLTPELERDVREGNVLLGGCIYRPGAPMGRCLACGKDIGRMDALVVTWERDPTHVDEIVAFILANLTQEYIASGEILLGFATDARTWSPDLPALVREDVERAIADGEEFRLATVRKGGVLVATRLLEVFPHARVPHALLHDFLVVSGERDRGIGTVVHAWVEAELRVLGIQWLSLESGVTNERAHAFFERIGFHRVADTFMKRL